MTMSALMTKACGFFAASHNQVTCRRLAVCALLVIGVLLPAYPGAVTAPGGSQEPPTPSGPELWVSGRYVKQVLSTADGKIWAATDGGVLCWPPTGGPAQRWTTAEGLRSNDVRAIAVGSSNLYAATGLDLHQITPEGNVVFYHSFNGEEIRCLVSSLRGGEKLWVGTSGGIYVHSRSGWQQIFSGAVWRMASDGRQHWAITSVGLLRLDDNRRFSLPMTAGSSPQNRPRPVELGTVTTLAPSSLGVVLASAQGTWTFVGGRWARVMLPPNSAASHVSALVGGPTGIGGLYGDGLYRLNGGTWKRLPDTPTDCGYVTALARTPSGLLAGTRTGGVWQWSGGRWIQLPLPHSLPAADIYGLVGFRHSLWAGTFDGGILRMDGQRIITITKQDGLSSNSPRGFLVFNGSLYVRYATGQLDRFDGFRWRPAFTAHELVRPEIYSFATSGGRLYLGGCEGWLSTDGSTWEQHYHDPELKGQVLTAMAAGGGEVWMGTQKQGLFCFRGGSYIHYHEAHGLTDDWITCLTLRGDRLLVGTYTGGLLERQGERFVSILKAELYAIRAIGFRSDGDAMAATPLGLYVEDKSGWHLLNPALYGGAETQCLLPIHNGTWIGSRTVLAFLPGS